MITFTNIDIQGFGSIPHLKLPLNYNGIIWVKGPNGVGKTTFFSALVWGLYGKSLKGVNKVNTWDKIQPKNYSGTKVEIYFIKDSIPYKVIRCQKYIHELDDGAKGRDRLLIYKDGDLLDVKMKFSAQEALNKILGISYKLFINSIVFGQGLKRLVQEDNSDKRSIFEEIFNLNFLNTAKDIAKGRKDSMREGILDMENDLNVMTDKLENYKDLKRKIRVQELEFENKRAEKIKQLEDTRLDYTKKLLQINKEQKDEVMQTLPVRIKHNEHLISRYKHSKELCEEIIDIPLDEYVDEIYGLVKDAKYDLALKSLRKLRKAYKGIAECDKQLSNLYKRKESLLSVQVKYKDLEMKGNWYANKMAQIDQELKSLKEEKLDISSNDYYDKIKVIRKKIKPLKAKYETQLSEYKDYQWLLDDPLGNQGIKAFLFDSSIDLINNALDKYAPVLGFYIQFGVKLESARKDFTTLISRGDTDIEYDELSGGEKQLVNIALAFAMNEVLTVSQGFNIAFLDEVFESLSPENIEIVSSLIKQLYSDKTLFIITHLDTLDISNVKILQVKKVNGLSDYQLL